MDFDRVNIEWNFVEDLDTDLPLWFGYSIKGSSDFTFDYEETMTAMNGSANDPGAQADHFAPLTNPYSSSYEVFKGGSTLGTNLYDVIWVWNQTSGSGGAYDYYASAGGGNFSGKVARGQSFFVKAIATATSTYTYNASSRVFVDGDNFLKKNDLLNWDDDFGKGTYAMFKVVDGLSKNSVFVSFGENGTNGIENGYDVFKKFGGETTPQLYLIENGTELSMNYIESLKEAEERTVVMNFKPGINGEHTLAANLNSLPETKVTLEDLQTGTLHEFNQQELYTFNANTEDDPDRFLLHFIYGPTGIENSGDTPEDHVSIYSYNKAIYISSKLNMTKLSDINIFDLLGREILSDHIEIGNTIRIPVDISNSYVVVRVITDNKITTTKVFVN